MILRRLTAKFRKQDWTAVTVELLIVVLGVFIGLQASNWNQERADRAEYETALVRFGEEIDTNLASLDAFDLDIERSLATGSRALTVLQSCVDSEEDRRTVDAGLEEIRGTSGLHPRRNALDEETHQGAAMILHRLSRHRQSP